MQGSKKGGIEEDTQIVDIQLEVTVGHETRDVIKMVGYSHGAKEENTGQTYGFEGHQLRGGLGL